MYEKKQDVINDITDRIGAPRMQVSNGSTEPKALFVEIVRRLDLGIPTSLSKPKLAESIATSAGIGWDATCDSRHTPSGGGSTVTIEGLRRVRSAVFRLT